jgi:hypothetical protein
MEKEFVTYELALELKNLGFDEPCLGAFMGKDFRQFDFSNDLKGYVNDNNLIIGRPTYSQAFRWFREKHNLFGQVNIHTYFIYNISNGDFKIVKEYDKLFETYEEAELACLKKLIEIVKTK